MAKFKGMNIDTAPTLSGIVCCVEIVWFEFAKINGAKVILHMKCYKSLTFRAAKLKVFTVLQEAEQ